MRTTNIGHIEGSTVSDGISCRQRGPMSVLPKCVVEPVESHLSVVESEKRPGGAESLRNRLFQGSLIEAVPVGIWRIGGAGRIHVNRACSRICGFDGASVVSSEEWASVLHPDDAIRVHRTWYEASHSERSFNFQCTYRILRHDGSTIWAAARAVSARLPGGAGSEFLGTLTDITDDLDRARSSEAHYRLDGSLL